MVSIVTKDRIGFVGTGAMGGGMSRSLLRAGFDVVAYDINPVALGSVVRHGAAEASSPRAVADDAAVVFACLPAPEVSIDVAAEIAQGSAVQVYVETSTIGSAAMDAVRARLGGTRIDLLDGPISGGSRGAEAGVLSTIVSGSESAITRVRPAIDAYAEHVFLLGGEPGQAQVAKLINNLLSMASRALTFEGVATGLKVGIDPVILAQFINVSTGRNMATMDEFPSRLLHIFHTSQKKSIGIKDLELYVAEANRLGAPLIAAPAILDLFREGAHYANPQTEKRAFSDYVDELRQLGATSAKSVPA